MKRKTRIPYTSNNKATEQGKYVLIHKKAERREEKNAKGRNLLEQDFLPTTKSKKSEFPWEMFCIHWCMYYFCLSMTKKYIFHILPDAFYLFSLVYSRFLLWVQRKKRMFLLTLTLLVMVNDCCLLFSYLNTLSPFVAFTFWGCTKCEMNFWIPLLDSNILRDGEYTIRAKIYIQYKNPKKIWFSFH